MVRYFLLEYFYEKKRGKQIEKNLIDEYLWLKEYKNKYAGKRCFVICNGPSLTQEDYLMLKDEYTFGMNMIFNWFEKTGIETDFFVCQDYFNRALDMKEGLMRIKESKVLLSDHMFVKYGFNTEAKHFLIPASMWNIHFPRCLNKVMINEKKLGFAIGNSVAFLCVELACYMGFSEIYLLGADCTFDGGVENMHASGLGGNELDDRNMKKRREYLLKNKKKIYGAIIEDCKIAKKYAHKHHINIFNVTRGGALEVFERKELEDVVFH